MAVRPMALAVAVLVAMAGGCSAPSLGPGSPWTRHTIDASALGADGVRAADVNGDGLVDFVAGWEQSGVTRAYVSRPDARGAVWRAVTVGATPDVEDAVFFDADGNGVADVVSCAEGDARRVAVHWAPDSERYEREEAWTTETLHSDGSRWMIAAPMDVDGQRGADLVVGGKNEGASIGWLESPEDPRRVRDWTFHHIGEAGWVMSLVLADMDRDGDQDVLVSDRYGKLAGVRWMENPGAQSPDLARPWVLHWVGLRGSEVLFVALHDLDGDGVDEIVAPHARGEDWRLSILKRDSGDGWREFQVRYPSAAGRPKAVAVGDVDLDGRPDLVLTAEKAYDGRRGVVWLRCEQFPYDPGWEAFDVSGTEGTKFDMALLVDVDGDGDPDVVTTEEHDNAANGERGLGVIWYENPRSVIADQLSVVSLQSLTTDN